MWDEETRQLVLRASSGLYTSLQGRHARIALGAGKIGLVARDRVPHLTNDCPTDPMLTDPEWARREGMVAFAGYPLMYAGHVTGVVAEAIHVP